MHHDKTLPPVWMVGWADWFPLALATGIACYFALPTQPPLPWVGAVFFPAYAWLLWWRDAWVRRVCMVMLWMMLGFGLAWWQTERVRSPVIPETYGKTLEIQGRVQEVSLQDTRVRVVLDEVYIKGLAAQDTPALIRVTIRGNQPTPQPLMRVKGRGTLFAPTGAVMPDGFDFGRYFYFRRIGGMGFLFPDVQWSPPDRVDAHAQMEVLEWLRVGLSEMRVRIAKALQDGLGGGNRAGIATALVTGDTMAIDDTVMLEMQRSGLMHILSISGMHMGIICGLFYTMMRWVLLCIPFIARRYCTQKLSAMLAICAGVAYLALADFPVAAVRACVMTTFFLMAVIVGRQALSLRSLTLAATAILCVQPSSLVEVSFQLSFMATLALIVGYRLCATRRAQAMDRMYARDYQVFLERKTQGLDVGTDEDSVRERISFARKVAFRQWCVGVCWSGIAYVVTSVVISVATAPLVAFHFHNISLVSLVANIAAMPLMGLWVMPALVLLMLLMAVGSAGVWLYGVVGVGLDGLIALAHHVVQWSWSTLAVPPMLPAALYWMAMGVVMVLLARTWRYRVAAVMMVAVCWAGALMLYPYDTVIVSPERKEVAWREDGARTWQLIRGKSTRGFAVKQWRQHWGLPIVMPARDAAVTDAQRAALQAVDALPIDGVAYAGQYMQGLGWYWRSYCDVAGARAWNRCPY